MRITINFYVTHQLAYLSVNHLSRRFKNTPLSYTKLLERVGGLFKCCLFGARFQSELKGTEIDGAVNQRGTEGQLVQNE